MEKESNARFDMLFISDTINKVEILVYKAFHSENEDLSSMFKINELK